MCTGNIFRSLTAELALRKALGNDIRFNIASAGTTVEPQTIMPYVDMQLRTHGLNPDKHKQRALTKDMLEKADAVIAMNTDHLEHIRKGFGHEVFLFGDVAGNASLNFSDIREAIPDWDTNETAASRYTRKVIDKIVAAMPNLADRMQEQPLSDLRNAPAFLVEEYNNKWGYIKHTEEMEFKLIQWYLVVAGGLLAFAFSDFGEFSDVINNPLTALLLLFVVVYSIFLCILLLVQKSHYVRHLDRLEFMERVYGGLERQVASGRVITSFRARYVLIDLIGSGCVFLLALAWGWSMPVPVIAAALFFAGIFGISFLKRYRH